MKPIKSQKLRDSARGRECTFRLPMLCNFNPETVVLCHLPTIGTNRMGGKVNDTQAAYGCSSCHDVIDGKNNKHSISKGDLAQYKLDAWAETQNIMLEEGLIKCT